MESIIFYIVFGIVCIHFVLFVFFTEKMKKLYPQQYQELGEPSIGLFSTKRYKAGKKFSTYLRKREYITLDDSNLVILGNMLLLSKVLFYFGFIALIVTFFVL
ncbi:MAG TPA: hypothetical protein DHV30_13245 [Balneola sp.]|nr:hypothetical protein [Balneola sp.]